MTTQNQRLETGNLPTSFIFHHDARHGWLEVPYETIRMLQLEEEITGYSYRLHDTVFLEEDVDAQLFIDYYLQQIGNLDYNYFWTLCKNQFDGDASPIRSYPHFK